MQAVLVWVGGFWDGLPSLEFKAPLGRAPNSSTIAQVQAFDADGNKFTKVLKGMASRVISATLSLYACKDKQYPRA